MTVIGGANMDINCFSHAPLNMSDSNPGKVDYCPGGVGRNIAENLCRLGTEVRFIGVIGGDPGGEFIKHSSAGMRLNIEYSLFLKSKSQVTSVYAAMMDSNGVMKLAISDMDIMEQMTEEHIESKADIIKESAIVLLDTNLPERIIAFILDRFAGGSTPETSPLGPVKGSAPLFFLDSVSAIKAPRAASRIGKFDTLKLGSMEASSLSGIHITGEPASAELREKLKEASFRLTGKGVRRVFITLGKEGVFAVCAGESSFYPVRYVQPVNTSGAGDAFMAGLIYGTLMDWDEKTLVSFSLAMARITVQSKSTVCREMRLDLVNKNLV